MKKALIIPDPGLFTKLKPWRASIIEIELTHSKLTGSSIAGKGFAFFA